MIIQTPIFGEIEIDDNKIMYFEKGIPGFPDLKTIVLLELPETPFQVMQSLQDKIYFFLINPFQFFRDYEVDIPDSIAEFLGIEKEEEVAVYNIVTLYDEITQSTANMQAPILINARTMKGKQIVLNESKYLIRQPIFTQVATSSAAE